MANAKTREKRREKRWRDSRKEEEEILEKEEIPVEEVEPEGDESQSLQKDYGATAIPMMGPTSYDELDAMRAAQEQAEEVRKESWTVQDLVYNIAYSPMSPEEKSKAIIKVGKDFGTRLRAVASGKMEKSIDMDLLQLQALYARDARGTTLLEKSMDVLAGFLSQPKEGSKVFIRKQVKDAIQKLESGDESIRESIPDLITSAKNAGIGTGSNILIEKDASGSWRGVLFPTNNFKDRDGEILSESAHEEFVEWVNKNMDCAPVFCTWHQPGTARTHQMDFIGYDNGIMVTSLPLTDEEAAHILKAQTVSDIGLSIGGLALTRDENVITKYRMFEVSDLPLERAANPYTDLQLISKEAEMKPEAIKKYLSEMLGSDERATQIMEKMQLTQTELRKAGVEEKEAKVAGTPETELAAPATVPSPDMAILVEKLSKELGMQELSDTIAGLMATADKVPVLEALVKELASKKEDDLAEMINPPIQKQFSWLEKRATQRTDTLIDEEKEEDKKLKKSVPELGWLSEATGTTPVVTQ